eukprot:12238210-Alexandrium_andersonii.AAC.1
MLWESYLRISAQSNNVLQAGKASPEHFFRTNFDGKLPFELHRHPVPFAQCLLDDCCEAEWATFVTGHMREAFPEYKRAGFNIAEVMLMEMAMTFEVWRRGPENAVQSIEGMAGVGNLTRAMHEAHLEAVAFDRKYNPCLDASTVGGLRLWTVA